MTPGNYWHADSLRDRSVIVTGAARGIGRGIAEALLQRGAAVLLVDVAHRKLAAAVAELSSAGYRAYMLAADLRDPNSPAHIVTTGVELFGAVNGLVNNAMATHEPKPFTDISAEDLALDYDVGPRATFLLMQAVQPVMVAAGGGCIVNLGSGSGTGGEPLWGGYASAKEAVRGMSKVAAAEWGRSKIRVNTVCPFAESDGTKLWREHAPDDYERAISKVPLGRIGNPRDDVGALVAFLMSSDALYLTGQTINVDGGTGTFR